MSSQQVLNMETFEVSKDMAVEMYQCSKCKYASPYQSNIIKHRANVASCIGSVIVSKSFRITNKDGIESKMKNDPVKDSCTHVDIHNEVPDIGASTIHAPGRMDRAAMIKHLRWDLPDDDPLAMIPPGLLEGIQPVKMPLGNPEWRADKQRRAALHNMPSNQ